MTVIELLESKGVAYELKERDNVYTDCPHCGSGNLSINIHSGVYHCWSADCEKKGHVRTLFKYEGEFTAGEAPVRDRTLTEDERKAIEHSLTNKVEIIEFCTKRNLDHNYVIKNKVIGYDTQVRAVVFPFHNQKGELCGAKYRGDNGDQWIRGEEPLLYLLSQSDLKKDKIVIVEGEVDAITLKQFGIPAAATLGAGKTKGVPLLGGCRQVLIGTDMDPAGDAGAEKLAAEIGRFRCKRVRWELYRPNVKDGDYTLKDPNDIIGGGGTRDDILACLKTAKTLAIDLKSKNVSETMNEYLLFQQSTGTKRLSWGYPRLDAFTKGIGGGMFIGVLAEAGTGKTTFIVNAAVNNATAGTNVGVCSLEEHPVNEVTPKVAATLVGRNPGLGGFAPEEIELIQPQMKRIQLYDGDDSADAIADWIRECYFVHDVRVCFIDYLQLLVPDEKDVQSLKEICYKFKKITKELPDMCVVMIVQPKQKQRIHDKGKEVRNKLDGSDARGGAAINQSVDAMLTIRVVDGHPNITQFEYTKVRGHLRVSKKDWLNQFTQLEYDHQSLRQSEVTQIIYGG